MNPVLVDLFTGTATPDVIALAGRVLGILLLVSCCLGLTSKWAPRWCHLVAEYAVILAWIVWGSICFMFIGDFTRHFTDKGWTTNMVELEYGGNVLGYFGFGMVGAILAVVFKWTSLRDESDGDEQ